MPARKKTLTRPRGSSPARTNDLRQVSRALRRYALSFPGATEDFPRSGTGTDGLWFELSQLPVAQRPPRLKALDLPFAKPTGYGLGKSGWVSATFEAKDRPPVEILEAWIRESYSAVAPKKLVAELDSPA
jgi:hypothetical protein